MGLTQTKNADTFLPVIPIVRRTIMIKTIQIYDEHILSLIDQIDKECHKFDSSKYGIPPEPIRNAIKVIVYRWIASQQPPDQK